MKEECSKLQKFQKLSADLLKFHHGEDWITHHHAKVKTDDQFKKTTLYLMPIMMRNFRIIKRKQKIHDYPQLIVVEKE